MLMTKRMACPAVQPRTGDGDRRKMRNDRLDRGARRKLSARALEATAFFVELSAEGKVEMERQEKDKYQSQRAHQPAGFGCRART